MTIRMKPYRSSFRRPTAVDLFAGSGAVTEGLRRSGFRVVAAVDNDPLAGRTFRANHPTVRLYRNDIRKIDPTRIRNRDLNGRDVDVLTVCAPCQPFSSQNRHKEGDPRASLILQSIRFAKALKPKVIFFENVPGLAHPSNRSLIQRLKQGLARLGYFLGAPAKVDAADYGVPQRRVRCILLAVRGSAPPSALPRPASPAGQRRTVRDAIGHLRSLAPGEADPNDPLHQARRHLPIAVERLQHIPKDGGSRSALPERLVLDCHKNHRGHPDVYGRMAWSDVAPTLTTGCTDLTRGRFAHPQDDRAITLREAAYLQTFPANYVFRGNGSQVATQIGNAVPVRLIKTLGPLLRRCLRTHDGRTPAIRVPTSPASLVGV